VIIADAMTMNIAAEQNAVQMITTVVKECAVHVEKFAVTELAVVEIAKKIPAVLLD